MQSQWKFDKHRPLSSDTRSDAKSLPTFSEPLRNVLFVLFVAWSFVECLLLWMPATQPSQWHQALFVILATATTLVSLAHSLPAQNVVVAATLIALISSVVNSVSAATGIPFGPRVYSDAFGPGLFDLLPWPIPLVWVIVILNSRGVARLILRPWRKTPAYGFWVIGLTCVLAVILDFGLEPFATQANRWWIWQTAKSVPAWFSAPWVNFVGWLVTTLLILAFVTPWLINKKGVKQPPDYHPLIVWLLMNLYVIIGNALHQLWPAVGLSAAAIIIAAIYAVRGARW